MQKLKGFEPVSREPDGPRDEDDVGEVLLLPQLREVRVKDALEDRSLGQLRTRRTKGLLEIISFNLFIGFACASWGENKD